jgi:hypothetical protein
MSAPPVAPALGGPRDQKASTILAGLYFGLTREASVHRGSAGWMKAMVANDFMDPETDFKLRQMVTILEQLHAADHGSVWSYVAEGARVAPVFRGNPVEREEHESKIAVLQTAATAELRRIFAREHTVKPEELTPQSAWATLVDLCLYPSSDEVEALGSLRYFDGFEHAGTGVPVAARLPTSSREDAEAILEKHTWIAGSLKNWLAEHPQMQDTARALARSKSSDERWIAQFHATT